ncbi:MAG: endonuclease III [Candidatus Eisenbacteria bacterium]|nr:endonuclease III [Candidatus Eisenbacteria bacterium]
MPRRSPRSKRKAAGAKLPQKPRVRSAPGSRKAASASAKPRAPHAKKGARSTAAPVAARKKAVRKLAARPKTKPAAAAPPAKPAKAGRFSAPDPVRVRALIEGLRELYPDAKCALDFSTPLQLLIATILSAQCTDERVNKVTPVLFARWPDAAALAQAELADIESVIHSTGFFRNKAKSIKEACSDLVEKYAGQVPRDLEQLVALRGVGRKTANVVLGNAYGINSGVVVDTHVTRLSNRLGLTTESDAVKIEFALQPLVPQEWWTLFSHWLILHGRAVCNARKPMCSQCPLSAHCPRIGVTVSA